MEEVLIIGDHIWGDAISVIFTDDVNKIIRRQCRIHKFKPDKYLLDKHDSAAVLNVEEDDFRATWVVFDFNLCAPDVICHECGHLTYNLLATRHIEHTHHTDEVYQYTHGWLFKKMYDFWLELHKQKK